MYVVTEAVDEMSQAVLVVPAPSWSDAQELVKDEDLQTLLETKVLVPIHRVKRNGRTALPLAPVWCSTIHKGQGATIDWSVLYFGDKITPSLMYTAISRVRHIDNLFLMEKISPSVFLCLRFGQDVQKETARLRVLE